MLMGKLQSVGRHTGATIIRTVMRLTGSRVKMSRLVLMGMIVLLGVQNIIYNTFILKVLTGAIDLVLLIVIYGVAASGARLKKHAKALKLTKHEVTAENLRKYAELAQLGTVHLWRNAAVRETIQLKNNMSECQVMFNEYSQLVRKEFMENINKVKGLEAINKESIILGELVACYGNELAAAKVINNSTSFQGLRLTVYCINFINVTTGSMSDIIFAMVHELSHSITNREDVADYIAMSVCFESSSAILKYCGCKSLMHHVCDYKAGIDSNLSAEKDYKRSLEYLPENIDMGIDNIQQDSGSQYLIERKALCNVK